MAWGISLNYHHNVDTLRRSPVAEISGALGDLGTLLPLMTALAVQGSVSLSSTLVFSGLFNIITGSVFGIPLPVQPMKAIAASAIASKASLYDTVAAGGLVSAAVLFLAATGLLRWLAYHVPVPVVKGIQLGAGLSLTLSAGTATANGLLSGVGWVHPSALDNRVWALAAFAGLLLTQRGGVFGAGSAGAHGRQRRLFGFVPYALIAFLLGLGLAIAAALFASGRPDGPDDDDGESHLPRFGVWHPRLVGPHWLSAEAWSMAVAQLPLTTLNSVVAVSALAHDLFHEQAQEHAVVPAPLTSVTAFGCSVGVMNLVGCWFGAMPVCHGAGGLAAQYRFGARSGASVVLLGAAKTLLGLGLGETLVGLLGFFPRSILAVLVLASGLELALAGQSLNHEASDLRQKFDDAGHGSGGDDPMTHQSRHSQLDGNGGPTATPPHTSWYRTPSPEERRERWTVMLTTAACLLAFKNDAVGFAAGLLCHGAYRFGDWASSSRQSAQEERASLLS